MNLAARDIRHNLARFGLTACGIGLLLMIVLGMGGIYHGLVYEATLLVDRVNADLWVVQRNTRGPFAEISSVPASVENRLLAVPGVANSRRFVYWTIQRSLWTSSASCHPGPGLAGSYGSLAALGCRPTARPGALRNSR